MSATRWWTHLTPAGAGRVAALIRRGVVLATVKDEWAKRARLRAQWPKRCGCGLEYSNAPGARRSWLTLAFAYAQRDAFGVVEYRHCTCGSTIGIITQIHNLKAE